MTLQHKPRPMPARRSLGARNQLYLGIEFALREQKSTREDPDSLNVRRSGHESLSHHSADHGNKSSEGWMSEADFLAAEDASWDYDDTVTVTTHDQKGLPLEQSCALGSVARLESLRNGAATAGLDNSCSSVVSEGVEAELPYRIEDEDLSDSRPQSDQPASATSADKFQSPKPSMAAGTLFESSLHDSSFESDANAVVAQPAPSSCIDPFEFFEDYSSDREEDGAGLDADDNELEPFGRFDGIPVPFDSVLDEEQFDFSDESTKRQRIGRQEEIQKFAMEVARAVGWDEEGLHMIEWVLQPYRSFGAVKRDLSAFIPDRGVETAELELCARVRSVWADQGYCRGWVFSRNGGGARAVDWKINLDWWTALDLIRTLDVDDEDEVRLFIECAFEDWVELTARFPVYDVFLMDARTAERAAMQSFHGYLQLILELMQVRSSGDWNRMPPFLDPNLFPCEEGIRDCASDQMDPIRELSFDE